MRIVSTVHKLGFDAYGAGWISGMEHWEGTPILYTEGFDLGCQQIKSKRIEAVERCESFKAKYVDYKPSSWQWDVVRWCNKVYAQYDALYDYDDLGVWLDCDCVTFKPMTEELIRSMIPEGNYLSMFKRTGMPTETGFIIRDCSHPMHKEFMDTWLKWYETGAFKTLPAWEDNSTMDATVRLFEKKGMKTHSLSAGFERNMNPMDLAPISEYITHRKGARKWINEQV